MRKCTICDEPLVNGENWTASRRRHQCSSCRRSRWQSEEWFLMVKSRARGKDIVFELEPGDLIIPDRCPVLGLPLRRHVGKGTRRDSPTIDRRDPALGYVPGNVRVVSHLANDIKGRLTPAEAMRAVFDPTRPANRVRPELFMERLKVAVWLNYGR